MAEEQKILRSQNRHKTYCFEDSSINISEFQQELNCMNMSQLYEKYSQSIKSNEIKNILNQFENFINKSGDQVVIESISDQIDIFKIRKEFHTFCKRKQPNQSFLVSVMKSRRYKFLFQYFLDYYIEDWIENSRIRNIKAHLICIVFFKKCYKDSSFIEKIKAYKKQR